jgi:hypothetical protein
MALLMLTFPQNFSSVRNAYVAKLKSLKEAKRTGVAAPIATQLSGIVVYYYHRKHGLWRLIISLLLDSKAQARKQSACPPSRPSRSFL